MSRHVARGLVLAALTVASWPLVADVSARLFDGPASALVSMAGGGLVGVLIGVPAMLHLFGIWRTEDVSPDVR